MATATATQAATTIGTSVPVVRQATVPTNDIEQPGRCYVLGCRQAIVREADATAREFRHKRFGRVHSCAGHDPQRG